MKIVEVYDELVKELEEECSKNGVKSLIDAYGLPDSHLGMYTKRELISECVKIELENYFK